MKHNKKLNLKECPSTSGRHSWIMHAAWTLVKAGLSDEEAYSIIISKLTRAPQQTEISDALSKARSLLMGKSNFFHTSKKAIASKSNFQFDPKVLSAVAAALPDIDTAWVQERSPVDVLKCSQDQYLMSLFKLGEKVLIFDKMRNQGEFTWEHRGPSTPLGEFSYLQKGCDNGVWFLSNPCDGQYHHLDRLISETNPTGKTKRAEENITSFRYALLESDEADPNQWLSAIAQLPLPISSIVTSGGRSFHTLVQVNGRSKREWDEIVQGTLKGPLTVLGADPAALTAVRLTRMPGCYRYYDGKGRRYPTKQLQKLLYLNPTPTCTPISKI